MSDDCECDEGYPLRFTIERVSEDGETKWKIWEWKQPNLLLTLDTKEKAVDIVKELRRIWSE